MNRHEAALVIVDCLTLTTALSRRADLRSTATGKDKI